MLTLSDTVYFSGNKFFIFYSLINACLFLSVFAVLLGLQLKLLSKKTQRRNKILKALKNAQLEAL
jgi:hypothetical protein